MGFEQDGGNSEGRLKPRQVVLSFDKNEWSRYGQTQRLYMKTGTQSSSRFCTHSAWKLGASFQIQLWSITDKQKGALR